jgi:hypothetical protein
MARQSKSASLDISPSSSEATNTIKGTPLMTSSNSSHFPKTHFQIPNGKQEDGGLETPSTFLYHKTITKQQVCGYKEGIMERH